MRMIELHEFQTNKPVWITIDCISSLERVSHTVVAASEKDYTEVWTNDESNFYVSETPAEIIEAAAISVVKCNTRVNQVSHKNKVASKSPTEPNKKKFRKSHYTMRIKNKHPKREPFSGFEK